MKRTSIYTITALLMSASILSCSTSKNIKLLPELKNMRISNDLYLSEFPNPSNYGAPGGIFYITYTQMTLPKILDIYKSIDKGELREIFIRELSKQLKPAAEHVSINNPEKAHLVLEILKQPYTKEDYKANPRLSNYDFTKVREKLATEYILEIYIFNWGHYYNNMHYTFINGAATIYNIKTNTIAWRYYFSNSNPIGALTISGVGVSTIDKELVAKSLNANIVTITSEVEQNLLTEFKEINKPKN
ncbi:MAG: hypothetical protein EPN93_00195 [Spirochaetes bacterium]|nr:MAG: hypothetical protein EPN93_00195 [Spirochaetota bacterium]